MPRRVDTLPVGGNDVGRRGSAAYGRGPAVTSPVTRIVGGRPVLM